eukprot:2288105-Rhodomonas_salina.1
MSLRRYCLPNSLHPLIDQLPFSAEALAAFLGLRSSGYEIPLIRRRRYFTGQVGRKGEWGRGRRQEMSGGEMAGTADILAMLTDERPRYPTRSTREQHPNDSSTTLNINHLGVFTLAAASRNCKASSVVELGDVENQAASQRRNSRPGLPITFPSATSRDSSSTSSTTSLCAPHRKLR